MVWHWQRLFAASAESEFVAQIRTNFRRHFASNSTKQRRRSKWCSTGSLCFLPVQNRNLSLKSEPISIGTLPRIPICRRESALNSTFVSDPALAANGRCQCHTRCCLFFEFKTLLRRLLARGLRHDFVQRVVLVVRG